METNQKNIEYLNLLNEELKAIKEGKDSPESLKVKYQSLPNKLIGGFQKKLLSEAQLMSLIRNYARVGEEKGYKPVRFAI